MNINELVNISAMEIARLIRTREVSALEVMETTIARIDAVNNKINAFVYIAYEQALDQAKKADEMLSKNRLDQNKIGALYGVPMVMKDSSAMKPGWPITYGGIPQLKDNLAQVKSLFVYRMEKAGAIFVGRSNAPIMGFRGTTDNPAYGPTCNPFDLTKNAGGSSGGSAAAVACGILPMAHATDGGGSIRIPAAWTNCVGFKASAGVIPFISRPNAYSAVQVCEGVISRNIEDTMIACGILSGTYKDDPSSLPLKLPFNKQSNNDETIEDLIAKAPYSLKGIKIAYSPNLDVFSIEDDIKKTVAKALNIFKDAGANIEETKIGIKSSQNQLGNAWCRMLAPNMRLQFKGIKNSTGMDLLNSEHCKLLPPQLLKYVKVADKEYSADNYYQDLCIRSQVFDAYQNTLAKYDFIISPTLSAMPVNNSNDGNTLGPTKINNKEINPLIGWCPTLLTNFSGHPSISIPAGLGSCGMPVGLHITGRRLADIEVLKVAAGYQQISPWQQYYSNINI